jgi:predicted permease
MSLRRFDTDPAPGRGVRKLRGALVRFAGLFRKRLRDGELDQELESHVQMLIDDNVRAGMTPGEARRQALARFGGIESVKEAYRDRRSIPLLETLGQDARYAARTLRKNAAATMLGILIMALGIGANTAVFSVVHAVVLNPLPYPNPERIVTLTYLSTGGLVLGDRSRQVSVPDVLDWQRESTSFDAMAYLAGGRGPVMAGSVAEYATMMRVSGEFFRVFAVQPAIGRSFSSDESRTGGAAMISDRYARQQFGDPSRAIGQVLRLANLSVPVVGILPHSFDVPADTDIWLPMVVNANQSRRGNNYRAVARLKAGVRTEQAQAEMTTISARLEDRYPDTNRNLRVLVTPLQHEMVGDVRSMLYLLLGAVALVLLIACATMATLLLAKATARVPEIAVRGALGATRARIVQQLLVEASVQAFVAGTLGVLLAIAGTRALVALSPPDVPRLGEVAVNGSVLLFTVAVCGLVSMLFGLPPALQAARVDVNDPLRRGSARVTAAAGGRMREVLVVAEIALAVVLVATGALLVRSLVALQRASLGFEPANVLVMQATATPRAPDWSDSRAFFQGLLADISRMPGVLDAGAMMAPPGRVGSESGYWIDRMPKESPLKTARPAVMNVISPGAFAALGIPFRQGRDFRDGDTMAAPRVVIVNDALARSAFPGRDPLGRVIVAGYDSADPMTIVGVVGDVLQYGPSRPSQPEVYLPYQQHFYNGATLQILVRTATDAAAFGPSIQRTSRERSPEVSVRMSTMDTLLSENIATPRFRAWLLSLFAIVALCLAMAGVYGVMAYVAGERSKEIGVRMALGATAGSVLWLMLSRGMKLTAIGLALGVLGAINATRLVSGMLFQVEPHDLTTYAGVVAGLGFLSLLATYVPARRATRIDPLVVLREE